jgi:simple sugar transport system permease protein
MNDSDLVRILSSIILASAPLIIAVCGETITERSGVVNLSLDGSMSGWVSWPGPGLAPFSP